MPRLVPRQPVPALQVPTIEHGDWDLTAQAPARFITMIVAYRGLHCPVCRGYLKELQSLAGEFESRGVAVLAVSTDDAERARETRARWGLANLTLGYDLSIDTARAWGLYISTSRGKSSLGIEEPARFAEPGLFLVRPDRTLYAAAVNTMPFARPHFKDVLTALDFIIQNDYPARGEA
ncbi:MAG: AhpC/TSA family protein [Candidatus Contendobacter sp.]|nr:AhpC/TSA family protein [Candidatus Contendobacter sp.]